MLPNGVLGLIWFLHRLLRILPRDHLITDRRISHRFRLHQAHLHCLATPIAKYAKVAAKWSRRHLGCFYGARVYHIFAVSILQFYLQLLHPYKDMLDAGEVATSRLF